MQQFQTHPVIGVSGSDSDSASVRAMMTQIRDTGAIPIFLGNHGKRKAADDITKIDALVVLGNDADIDPERYGQKPGAHTKPESVTPQGKARADYEYQLMLTALKEKMPVLGICGGMQRLNVLLGGSLHQHVPDLVGNDEHAQQDFGIAPFIPVQPVIITQDSMLGSSGKDALTVYTPAHGHSVGIVMENSMHHQAVDKVGNGLRAAAYAADKLPDGKLLVEAVECDPLGPFREQFIQGVQWHPEFSASPLGAKIAGRLAQEAAIFAVEHKREHPPGEAQDENIFSALPGVKMPQVGVGSMTETILRKRALAQQNQSQTR